MTASRKDKTALPERQAPAASLTSKAMPGNDPKPGTLNGADYYSTPATLRKLRIRQAS